MKRILLVAVAVAVAAAAAVPNLAAAQSSPTLALQEACTTSGGTRLAGVEITVSGVTPFSEVSGSLTLPDGGVIFGTLIADDRGAATLTFFSGPGLYIVRINSPFSAEESLEVDCLPDDKDECKGEGWRSFGVFANQGDCVSFVATGGRNPPGEAAP